jgi:multiple sugar transport system permease protein/sn-glycerol 3-phosphate transport system permease protein
MLNRGGKMDIFLEKKELFQKILEKEKIKNSLQIVFFLLPSIISMCLFIFYPLIKSIYLSLHMTNARGEVAKFVGTFNYEDLISSKEFIDSLVVSLKFTFFSTFFSVLISLFLSVLAYEKIKGISFFRTIFSSTLGVSVSAGSTIWLFLYHPSIGMLNKFLELFGINGIKWLTDSKYALLSIGITTVWMEISFGFLVLTAGLNNIKKEIYESCEIDGANYFTKLFKITLPLLSPSLYYLIVVNVIKNLQSFGQSHVLTGGGPANSTTTIVYRLWTEAFINYRFGFSSAIGLVLSIIIMIITIIQFRLERKVHYQ